jgi:peptide/nickel transport system substrate-binding protein
MHKDGVQAYLYTPETDKMIEEAGATIKQERRKEIYYKLQRIVKEEAPWLFMWGQIDLIGINKRIDWKPSKDEIVRFYDIKLKK